jgi:hypothetical protein
VRGDAGQQLRATAAHLDQVDLAEPTALQLRLLGERAAVVNSCLEVLPDHRGELGAQPRFDPGRSGAGPHHDGHHGYRDGSRSECPEDSSAHPPTLAVERIGDPPVHRVLLAVDELGLDPEQHVRACRSAGRSVSARKRESGQ